MARLRNYHYQRFSTFTSESFVKTYLPKAQKKANVHKFTQIYLKIEIKGQNIKITIQIHYII